MIYNVYSIYDNKAEEYGPIFEAKNNSVAIRKCKIEFKDLPTIDDFSLYCLGVIDHDNGEFDFLDVDVHVEKVCDLKGIFDFEETKE